jgi:hypothetical protein
MKHDRPEAKTLDDAACALLAATSAATASAPNEASLRHELENALEAACHALASISTVLANR